MTRLRLTIAQPAEAVEAHSAGEGVARFALIELHSRLPPQSRQLETVEHEQRALDPSDFAQSQRQAILAGIGGECIGGCELPCKLLVESSANIHGKIPGANHPGQEPAVAGSDLTTASQLHSTKDAMNVIFDGR